MVCVDEKRLVGEIVSVTTVLVAARSTSTGSNVHSTVTGTTGRVLVLTIYNIIPCVFQKEYMELTAKILLYRHPSIDSLQRFTCQHSVVEVVGGSRLTDREKRDWASRKTEFFLLALPWRTLSLRTKISASNIAM